MDRDRLPAEQACVFERVRRHQRDLLLGDHLQDRAGDRDIARLRRFEEARQLRHRLPLLVEEEDQAALHRKVLEDHVHHGVEQRVEVVALQERLRDLDEDLEDLLACDRRRRSPGRSLRARLRLLCVGEVEAELGIEVRDASDHRARRVVEHRLIREIDRGERLEVELDGTDVELVSGGDLRLGHQVPVHLHAIGRFQVDDPPAVVARFELGVLAGDRRMVQNEVVSLRPADGEIRLEVRDPRHAHVHVMDLKLFHSRSANYIARQHFGSFGANVE